MSFDSIANGFLHLHPMTQAIIRAIIWFLLVFLPVPIFIWWERRLLGWIQDRVGPNRVGPFGLLQPLADGAKSFFKEDFVPASVDKFLYTIAPAVSLFPAIAIGATVPWAAWRSLTPVADVNIGVLYILAISSLGVYGVVLAGYSSNNKYSLMGGLRSSAQLISYELSMGMSLAAIVLASGSLRPTDMLRAQEDALWGVVPFLQNWNIFTPFGFLAAIIFLICMVAETNRAPFDLPEAENELVSGYNTEYTTKKWVLFMMGEYLSMFIYGGVFMTVFLGGYNLVPIRWDWLAQQFPSAAPVWNFFGGIQYWLAPVFYLGKAFAVITFYIWLRATMPRLRYDQLMSLGWKSLLPIATANFVVVALWIVSTRVATERSGATMGVILGWLSVILAIALLIGIYRAIKRAFPGELGRLGTKRSISMVNVAPERRSVEMVDPNVAEAGAV